MLADIGIYVAQLSFGLNPITNLGLSNLFIYLGMNEENVKNLPKPYLIARSPWRIRAATSTAAFLPEKWEDSICNLCQEGGYKSPKTKHCVQPCNNKSSNEQNHSSR